MYEYGEVETNSDDGSESRSLDSYDAQDLYFQQQIMRKNEEEHAARIASFASEYHVGNIARDMLMMRRCINETNEDVDGNNSCWC